MCSPEPYECVSFTESAFFFSRACVSFIMITSVFLSTLYSANFSMLTMRWVQRFNGREEIRSQGHLGLLVCVISIDLVGGRDMEITGTARSPGVAGPQKIGWEGGDEEITGRAKSPRVVGPHFSQKSTVKSTERVSEVRLKCYV